MPAAPVTALMPNAVAAKGVTTQATASTPATGGSFGQVLQAVNDAAPTPPPAQSGQTQANISSAPPTTSQVPDTVRTAPPVQIATANATDAKSSVGAKADEPPGSGQPVPDQAATGAPASAVAPVQADAAVLPAATDPGSTEPRTIAPPPAQPAGPAPPDVRPGSAAAGSEAAPSSTKPVTAKRDKPGLNAQTQPQDPTSVAAPASPPATGTDAVAQVPQPHATYT